MALAINIMDGRGLIITRHIVNACPRRAILVVHFIVGGVAVLMAKLGMRQSAFIVQR